MKTVTVIFWFKFNLVPLFLIYTITGMENAVLVTGAAGFIGFYVALRLLEQGRSVVGVDNLNDYYDVQLKQDRLAMLQKHGGFHFVQADIADRPAMEKLWADFGGFKRVVHLAAQAGVRYSLQNPYAYINSNCMGHVVILEMCRHTDGFEHLVYASSSSVYGGNTKLPYAVQDAVDSPVSLYAATKRADELMSHAYTHLYKIPQTGLRFFTVYGPWGRPDMAPYIFTRAVMNGETVPVFNHGDMKRDFTYIDDIVDGVLQALDRPPMGDTPIRLLNLGNSRSENLLDFIAAIEKATGKTARTEMLPMQAGDVKETYADITETTRVLGYHPTIPIAVGIPKYVEWFSGYYL